MLQPHLYRPDPVHLTGRFLSPPGPAQEIAPGPPAEIRLADSMRRRLEGHWEGLDTRRRERLIRAYGAALATICGLTADQLGRETRRGSTGVQAILAEILEPVPDSAA
jgi:hypothetical protein